MPRHLLSLGSLLTVLCVLLVLPTSCEKTLLLDDESNEEGTQNGDNETPEEVGDTLFMPAKVAQMTGVDPEDALHRACDKFDARFRQVEAGADKPLSECSEEELLALWRAAKQQESSTRDSR